MINRSFIELACKDTLGYSEAENKKSFETGVSVCISKCEEYYSQNNQAIKQELESYKRMYEDLKKQIITVSDIFNQFKDY